MRKMSKRAAAITATAAVAVGGFGAAAYAAGWFKSTGTATASTASINEVVASATFGDKLYPGKTVTTTASVKNNNEFPVAITGIASGSLTKAPEGCTLENSAITAKLPAGTLTIDAGATATIPNIAVTMGKAASESCAGGSLEYTFQLAGSVA